MGRTIRVDKKGEITREPTVTRKHGPNPTAGENLELSRWWDHVTKYVRKKNGGEATEGEVVKAFRTMSNRRLKKLMDKFKRKQEKQSKKKFGGARDSREVYRTRGVSQ